MQEGNRMLRSDRLSSAARDSGKALATAGERLNGAVRGRKKSLMLAGTALALAGTGSASAATIGASAPTPVPAATLSAPLATPPLVSPAPFTVASVTTLTGAHAAADPATSPQASPSDTHQGVALTWKQVRDQINRQTNPAAARRGKLPLADRLTPVGTSGQQAWMPLSGTQLANATTIVRQALHHRMGIRSAVIALATAMQESQLLNLNYGDRDSLGLFQQRPSMGWGSAAQVTDPRFAADAFLQALRQHQASDPSWARQPLWASAQAVQNSGFPFAYAKWETQAAALVKQIATRVVTAQATQR
jgi:hypothetical protein